MLRYPFVLLLFLPQLCVFASPEAETPSQNIPKFDRFPLNHEETSFDHTTLYKVDPISLTVPLELHSRVFEFYSFSDLLRVDLKLWGKKYRPFKDIVVVGAVNAFNAATGIRYDIEF